MIRISLYRSEALAASHGLMETAEPAILEVATSDGPWVQFTYESLRGQDGEHLDLVCVDGAWWHNNQPYSDIVIELITEEEGGA